MGLVAFVATFQPATSQTGGKTTVLRCRRIIDGTGKAPLLNAAVVVIDDRVVAVGSNLPTPVGAVEIQLRDMTCLPGLIDLHVHLRPRGNSFEMSSADKALGILRNAQTMLRNGFTTVRGVGEPDRYYSIASVKRAIANGDFEGPRIFAAPHMMSATGGHADPNLAPDLDIELTTRLVNGPHEIRKAIRTEFKHGADWIKLAVTGGVMSSADDPNVTTFTDEELAAAVDETHRHLKKITVHAIGADGIKRAVQAGVDCVEHGFLIDDETIALMKAKGTWLVPTIYVLSYVVNEGPRIGYSAASIRKGAALLAGRDSRIRVAIAAGVKIAFGSDNIFPVQDAAREFAELVRLGLTPMQAIRAATANAAEVLGIQAEVGTLEAGKVADLVAVADDPLVNIRTLEKVQFVMRSGRIVKP